jgi:predicted nucleic acid-binding protein
MIVVSDTSPLTALLTVGEERLLIKLLDEVVIPLAVQNELLRHHARLPDWLRVAHVQDTVQVGKYTQLVDAGEAEAVELALELHADRVLMDERKGRKLAAQAGRGGDRIAGSGVTGQTEIAHSFSPDAAPAIGLGSRHLPGPGYQ